MNRYRELLGADQFSCEMANGVVEGRYSYRCKKGEVNFKLCSQHEMLSFTSVCTGQKRHWDLQFYYFTEAGELGNRLVHIRFLSLRWGMGNCVCC